MAERKEGIVEAVQETGAAISEAVAGAMHAVAQYLKSPRRKSAATNKRAMAARTAGKAAAITPRKTPTAKKSRAATGTKQVGSTSQKGKTAKSQAAAKGKPIGQGKRSAAPAV